MIRVVIESPYAGDVARNLRYLDACMADCLRRGESPYASHGLYTRAGVLDDAIPEERELGIQAGFAWRDVADLTVVYVNLGITRGMQYGIDDARSKGRPLEERALGEGWDVIERVATAAHRRLIEIATRAIEMGWSEGAIEDGERLELLAWIKVRG